MLLSYFEYMNEIAREKIIFVVKAFLNQKSFFLPVFGLILFKNLDRISLKINLDFDMKVSLKQT